MGSFARPDDVHHGFAFSRLINAEIAVFKILSQAIVAKGAFVGVLNAECHA
jgi:hypothetical protein